ncbi:MAG: hypothetical protein IKC48_03345 [Clostridia bacterium]|nr:hypothetical protein [Clostridia bacterium]
MWRYKTEYLDLGKSYADFVADYENVDFASLSDADADFAIGMSILMQARAQDATVTAYQKAHTPFLWIKSLWVADVPWKDALPDWNTFKTSMDAYGYLTSNAGDNPANIYTDNESMYKNLIKEDTYNLVTAKIRTEKSLYETNGYLIMVVLVVGLSLLSQFISQRQQKKSGQLTDANNNGMMKVMLWMMPILLLVFALTSSSAFTVYMVANSIMTLLVNFLTTFVVNLTDGTYKKKEVEVIRHGRIDPNDKINK